MKEIIRFKEKLNFLHYYDPTFLQNYVFLISPFSDNELKRVCNWVELDFITKGNRRGTTLFSKDSQRVAVVIWEVNHSVIFHELIHAVMSTFRKIGDSEIGFQNEESFAYYCQRLATVLYTYHPVLAV